MIGQKFERWTVIDTAPSKNGKKRWRCRCECGTERDVIGSDLRAGKSKSCGCLTREKAKLNKVDLTGKIFGYLTVEYDTGIRNNGKVMWHCKCKCGNECDVAAIQLTTGKTQSCGCLQKERTAEARGIDLTGQKFGRLTAEYFLKKENSKERYWHCKCECGNYVDVVGRDLKNGHTMSCGCLGRSKGEAKIENILKENNISFKMEYSFCDLWLGEGANKRKARFDFFVNEYYCIEFDGIQHFQKGSGYYDDEDKFQKTQKYDKIKNEYCLEHNIPLIRIPYTHLSKLCLEDLLLETSKFIIKKQED